MNTYVSIWLQDEAGIVPVGLVLHVGEVTDRSIIDTAAEDIKNRLSITQLSCFLSFYFEDYNHPGFALAVLE
ncbi:hypothetical protein ACE6H2_007903 [Prunus campanulata]